MTGKNEFWWFAVNALQGILSFARNGICYFLLIKMVLEGRITTGDFTMYFGAVAGFSVWLNDIAHQTGNLSRFSMECCDYREFIEMPDTYVNDGKRSQLRKGALLKSVLSMFISDIRMRRRIRCVT